MSNMMGKEARAILTHTRLWYLLDAANQRPGRVATQASRILQGKYKPIFHRSVDCGDHLVIINTKKIDFSGNKWEDKEYKWHTHYPGGFRSVQAKKLHARKPTEILNDAIWGMLPRNGLRSAWMDRLYLFPDEEHPYAENIYDVIEIEGVTQTRSKVPPMIFQAPGNLHLLDDFEKDETTGEVILDIKI